MTGAGVDAVASPCNSVCTIDAVTGYCAGCFRTLAEIAAWSDFSQAQRRGVIAALAGRRLVHEEAVSSRLSVDAQR